VISYSSLETLCLDGGHHPSDMLFGERENWLVGLSETRGGFRFVALADGVSSYFLDNQRMIDQCK